jgi:hypothetical protein
MALLELSEIFGYALDDVRPEAVAARKNKLCRFRGNACTKGNKDNPYGTCSMAEGANATVICPVRFIENNRIFVDAARIAFGTGVKFSVIPELRILRIEDRKIGKIDYLLAKLEGENVVTDFAAVEVQAVYFSGDSLRPHFDHYLEHGFLAPDGRRRPDYRSCAQKRLMPQLALKVPVFRRWGKKFFVVVDLMFFQALPEFKTCSPGTTEITWLTYPLRREGEVFTFGPVQTINSQWEDVITALREGLPPDPDEIIHELQVRLKTRKGVPLPVLST